MSIFSSVIAVTELAIVTEVDYRHINIYVDNNGVPYSTGLYIDQTYVTGEAALVGPTSSVDISSAQPTTVAYVTQVANDAGKAAAATASALSESNDENTSENAVTVATSTSATSTAAVLTTSPNVVDITTTDLATSSTAMSTSLEDTTSSATSTAVSVATESSTTSSGETYSGDATYYDVGLGACGITNSDSELVAAMNYEQFDSFGSMSNGNPICGKKAELHYGSKSVVVTIEDKCPGCAYGSIDLSPTAFQQLADESLGRIPITWNWV